jgi:hypothetical protein
MSGLVEAAFDERLSEVYAYLDFLNELEVASQAGSPRFGTTGAPLSPQQTHILKAGLFVQLYNLVEATITRCLDALSDASWSGQWKPGDLNLALRKEWVKVFVSANKDLNADNRLRQAVLLSEFLITASPLQEYKLEKGGGGNWSDKQIEEMLKRVGLQLRLSPEVRAAAKRKFRDDLGPLALIVKLRNDLAHGAISFSECGENETVLGLREMCQNTELYLRSIVKAVEVFIERHEFLEPARRPALP